MIKINKILSKLYWQMVGHPSRRTYWTCSNFAGWIRRITGVDEKPASATIDGWRQWRKINKSKFGYWLAEEGLDIIQDIVFFIPDVYGNVRSYIKNRYIDKIQYLNTKLKKGQYYDLDTRILHGLFEELVDFVEIEKAYMFVITSEEDLGKPPKRSAEYGLAYLDWEISLSEPINQQQKEVATTIKELYMWWKEERPKRPDPYKSDEDEDEDDDEFDLFGSFFNLNADQLNRRRDRTRNIIESDIRHYQEDTENLIRLIRIRNMLWT